MHIGEIIYGSILVLTLWGWIRLFLRWRMESHHARALGAMIMASLPVLLGNAALAYIDFVKPIPATDYTVEKTGILLSAAAVVAALLSSQCTERWIPKLTLTVSIIILALYLLAGMTI